MKRLGLLCVTLFFASCLCEEAPPAPAPPVIEPPKSAIPDNAIVVEYHTSKGKKGWVEAVTAPFNEARHEIDGRPVFVKLKHMRSGTSMGDIKEGKIQPSLWSPVSESWIELLNETWQDRHQKKFMSTWKPSVNVAMIVAMWEPMARALGWPDKPVGWAEIVDVIRDPRGWGAHGHPEWGGFGFGHAHPDHSTSAMLSVISLLYARTGKTSDLSPEDLKSPEVIEALKAVEEAVVHYGKSSSWLSNKMCERGPAYLSAVTLYESNVVTFNEKCPDKAFPVVAVYPKEGTFWADHPTGIVEAAWMTPEKTRAAQLYLDHLMAEAQQALLPKYGFRPAAEGVPLTAPFDQAHGVLPEADKGIALQKPTPEVFKRANELWHKVKPKATVTILFDVSGSMHGERIEVARKSTIEFLKHMEPEDEVQLIIFSGDIKHIGTLGKVKDIGEDLIGAVEKLEADNRGGTNLYGAVKHGLELVAKMREGRTERRTYGLVVLSDGEDNVRLTAKESVLAMLPKAEDNHGTRIYTIAFSYAEQGRAVEAKAFLQTIAARSNGMMQEGTLKNMDKIYEAISAYF